MWQYKLLQIVPDAMQLLRSDFLNGISERESVHGNTEKSEHPKSLKTDQKKQSRALVSNASLVTCSIGELVELRSEVKSCSKFRLYRDLGQFVWKPGWICWNCKFVRIYLKRPVTGLQFSILTVRLHCGASRVRSRGLQYPKSQPSRRAFSRRSV